MSLITCNPQTALILQSFFRCIHNILIKFGFHVSVLALFTIKCTSLSEIPSRLSFSSGHRLRFVPSTPNFLPAALFPCSYAYRTTCNINFAVQRARTWPILHKPNHEIATSADSIHDAALTSAEATRTVARSRSLLCCSDQ
jgi:hypothetical protein